MLSFSFLSHVSLVCFLKKWPKIDPCFGLFFSLQRKQTSVFYHKTTLKRPVLYISL